VDRVRSSSGGRGGLARHHGDGRRGPMVMVAGAGQGGWWSISWSPRQRWEMEATVAVDRPQVGDGPPLRGILGPTMVSSTPFSRWEMEMG
jgi:hypothetical protein